MNPTSSVKYVFISVRHVYIVPFFPMVNIYKAYFKTVATAASQG
jgi:hypothetical protein